MNGIIPGIIGAAITAAVGIVVVGVFAWVKRRVKITGPTAEAIANQGRQLATQQALVFMLVDLVKPQLLALLGILDALKDKMNGDFERAHDGIRQALDTFDETFRKIARGECQEQKA